MNSFEELKGLVADVEADVEKAEKGNKAAGTRVRKQMQSIKKAAQAVRQEILELRTANSEGAPPPPPSQPPPAAPTF